jgi:hypothetical protein
VYNTVCVRRAATGRRVRLPTVVAALVGAVGTDAVADSEPVAGPIIEWTGPPTCSRDDFDRSLGRTLAGSEVDLATSPRIVVSVVQKGAEHWQLELIFETNDATEASRSLEGRSCSTVIDAAAWVVAIAIDPSIADRMLGSEPDAEDPGDEAAVPLPPEPASPVEAQPEIEAAPDREPSTPEVEREPEIARAPAPLRAFLGVEVGPDGGTLPGVGVIVRGRVGLGGQSWRVDLTGAVRTPTRRNLDDPSWVGARFDLWLVGLHAGPVLGAWPVGLGTLEVPLWLGFEVGQVTASAFGFDDARRVTRPFLGPTAGAALAWAPHHRVAVRLGADLLVAPWRQEFFVGGLGRVHRTGWVAGRGTLGVEIRLGRPRRK